MLRKDLVCWVAANKAKLLVWLAVVVILLVAGVIVFIPVNNTPLPGRKVLWKRNLNGYIRHVLPNSDWSEVYVLTDSNSLYCFDKDGKQRWQVKVPLKRVVYPTISLSSEDDVLVVGGHVKAFRYSKEGELLWEFNSVLTPWFEAHSTPTSEDAEFAVWDDEFLIGLSIDGNVVWTTNEYDLWLRGRSMSKGESGSFIFSIYDNVVALEANGSERWLHQLRFGNYGFHDIQETQGIVLISDIEYNPKCGRTIDSYLYCLSDSGELLWEVNEEFFDSAPPSLFGENVVIVRGWDGASCYSTNGKLLWDMEVRGDITKLAANSDNSLIFLITPSYGSRSLLGKYLDQKHIYTHELWYGFKSQYSTSCLAIVDEHGHLQGRYKLPSGAFLETTGGPDGLVFETHGQGKTLALAQWDILK